MAWFRPSPTGPPGAETYPVIQPRLQDWLQQASRWLWQALIANLACLKGWLIGLIKNEPARPAPVPSWSAQLKAARNDLQAAKNYYDAVSDPDLLNYAIYQMQAAESKCSYFFRKVRAEARDAGTNRPGSAPRATPPGA